MDQKNATAPPLTASVCPVMHAAFGGRQEGTNAGDVVRHDDPAVRYLSHQCGRHQWRIGRRGARSDVVHRILSDPSSNASTVVRCAIAAFEAW
jgi:hypothetical protein